MKKLNKSQYESLRQKIIEAVPDIIKLQPGCKVQTGQYRHWPPMTLVNRDDLSSEFWRVMGHMNNLFYQNEKDFKIIGRDIRLADVLIAPNYPFEIYSNIDRSDSVQITCNEIRFIWDLKKNSLDHQSDVTKVSLYNLLCAESSIQ